MWRLRYALRKARLRLVRITSQNRLAFRARRLFPWLLLAALITGGVWYAADDSGALSQAIAQVSDAAGGMALDGWRFMVGQLSLNLDGDAGRGMVQSVLPTPVLAPAGPEPAGSWRTPLRAWVYVVTGYDFTSPRSFLESEVPGFRSVLDRRMDVVLVPRSEPVAEQDTQAVPEDRSAPLPPPIGPEAGQSPPLVGGEGKPVPTTGVTPPEGEAEDRGPAAIGPEAPPAGGSVGGERIPEEARAPLPVGVPPALAALTTASWGRAPLVLIVHSHTSESYRTIPPDPRATAQNHVYNSSDTGIVRVGRALAEKLQGEYNIPVIHSTRIHNWPHHARAYLSSRETVQEILEANPSIRVVLDIHRQGVPDFTYATTVDEVEAVGIDIIYTTGLRAGYPNPHWASNEAFANRLAAGMSAIHPGLLRRVMKIDDSVYNQDLHPRMLLLEVGNYLDLEARAVAAAQLLADPLARALSEILEEERDSADVPAMGRAVIPLRAPPPVPLRRGE